MSSKCPRLRAWMSKRIIPVNSSSNSRLISNLGSPTTSGYLQLRVINSTWVLNTQKKTTSTSWAKSPKSDSTGDAVPRTTKTPSSRFQTTWIVGMATASLLGPRATWPVKSSFRLRIWMTTISCSQSIWVVTCVFASTNWDRSTTSNSERAKDTMNWEVIFFRTRSNRVSSTRFFT